MIEAVCDGHCPLFGQEECELELFPGSKPLSHCPRYGAHKNSPEAKKSFPKDSFF